jgi:uncharacterized protein YjlB
MREKQETQTQVAEVLNPPNVLSFQLQDDGLIPNNALPLLIYQEAVKLTGGDPAAVFEELFAAHSWTGSWRDGIYTYHHYHSTTHEVLGVFRGSATVQFGGEKGIKQKIKAGDVVIIPAGVSHKNLGASSNFGVVGAYPDGQEPDINYGQKGERAETDANLAKVTTPREDPVYGQMGPLRERWG